MSFPAPHLVGWRKRKLGEVDRYNVAQETWDEPVEVPVIAIYQPSPDDARETRGKTPIERDVDILAPSWPGGPDDLAVFWGDTWQQVGHVEDFNHGPFGWKPGVRVSFVRHEENRRSEIDEED